MERRAYKNEHEHFMDKTGRDGTEHEHFMNRIGRDGTGRREYKYEHEHSMNVEGWGEECKSKKNL